MQGRHEILSVSFFKIKLKGNLRKIKGLMSTGRQRSHRESDSFFSKRNNFDYSVAATPQVTWHSKKNQGLRSRHPVQNKTKKKNAKCHYLHLKINQVICVSSTTKTREEKKCTEASFFFKGFERIASEQTADSRRTVSHGNTCGFSCWKTLVWHIIATHNQPERNNWAVERQAALP